jgi:HSP20 family protein
MSTLVKSINRSIKPTAFNTIMDRFFRDSLSDFWGHNFTETMPAVNITEKPESLLIEMAAPGLKKEDFKIEMDGNMMTISAEKKEELKEEKKNIWKREYNYTSFSRSFTLPENVADDNVSASYADGVLKLEIPKKEPDSKTTSRTIAVK